MIRHSRYADVTDVRHGYENLRRDVGDEPRYSGAAIKAVLENARNYNEAETSSTFDPVARIRNVLSDSGQPSIAQVGGSFTADFGPATYSNPAVERREAKRIADLDAAHANFRDVADYGTGRGFASGPQFHSAFEQGTPEWLAFREQYDITGSTVGSYLGHNRYTSPIKKCQTSWDSVAKCARMLTWLVGMNLNLLLVLVLQHNLVLTLVKLVQLPIQIILG